MAQRIDDRIMEFKILGEKEVLVPARFDRKVENIVDRGTGIVNLPGWEKKLCYVLEIKIKDPSYMYSKRLFYVSKDELINLCSTPYMIRYDQRGKVWRIQIPVFFNQRGNEKGNYENWVAGVTIDCQTKHATVFEMINSANPDTSIKAQDFELRSLIRRAR